MAERSKPKTFREMITFYHSFPRGRRITGYCGAVGLLGAFGAGLVAYEKSAGFLVFLVLAFCFFLCAEHHRYAFTENLTQRKVRRIDYWYLSAATIGLFLAAAGYSTQRDASINRVIGRIYVEAEPSVLNPVRSEIETLSKSLCEKPGPRLNTVCAGLKKVAAEVRPGRSAKEIHSIGELVLDEVAVPYAQLFSPDELSKNPSLLGPVVSLQMKIQDWEDFARIAPKPDSNLSKPDQVTRILIEFGQWVIWPFLLAYALALRITKVTIDVFEWAK